MFGVDFGRYAGGGSARRSSHQDEMQVSFSVPLFDSEDGAFSRWETHIVAFSRSLGFSMWLNSVMLLMVELGKRAGHDVSWADGRIAPEDYAEIEARVQMDEGGGPVAHRPFYGIEPFDDDNMLLELLCPTGIGAQREGEVRVRSIVSSCVVSGGKCVETRGGSRGGSKKEGEEEEDDSVKQADAPTPGPVQGPGMGMGIGIGTGAGLESMLLSTPTDMCSASDPSSPGSFKDARCATYAPKPYVARTLFSAADWAPFDDAEPAVECA